MISVRVEYSQLRDLQGRFQRLADTGVREIVAETVKDITERVYRHAQENIRSLFNTSGKMENALRMTLTSVGGSVSIEDVGYVTQETGGLRAYLIPLGGPGLGKKILEFEGEAGLVYTPYVLHPPLRRRSYLGLALEQTRGEMGAILANHRVSAKMVQR
jgi:hypothetical protein